MSGKKVFSDSAEKVENQQPDGRTKLNSRNWHWRIWHRRTEMNKRYDYVPYRTDRIVSVIARFVCRMMSGIRSMPAFAFSATPATPS